MDYVIRFKVKVSFLDFDESVTQSCDSSVTLGNSFDIMGMNLSLWLM